MSMIRFPSALIAVVFTSSLFAAPAPTPPAPKPAERSAAPSTAKPKPYPLTVCLVTDNDLGSMGEETSIVYEGQVVKFCCKPCEEKFLKNPAKYLAKLPSASPVSKETPAAKSKN